MRQNLLFVSILALIFILGCGVLPSAAPPDTAAGEPPAGAPTVPVPSILPTAMAPLPTRVPGLPERRRLTLEFPPEIRAGDSDIVRLTLEVDDLGNMTPTAQSGGNTVTGEIVEIPNLYESHHVVAEARFDIAGLEVQPGGLISEPLAPGNSVTFFWSIRPREAGIYRGTVWLYLRFVDKQSGEESQKTLSAQIVEIEAVNFLGLSGSFARTTGVIGSVLGTIMGFPFLEEIVKLLLRRRMLPK
jgi:hypothetical protein